MNAEQAVTHYPDQVAKIKQVYEENGQQGILQRNVDVSRSDFRTLVEADLILHAGWHEYYVEDKDGFSYVKSWEPCDRLQEVWATVDVGRGDMLPCDCLKDGFVNRGETVECKHCGQQFSKDKVTL